MRKSQRIRSVLALVFSLTLVFSVYAVAQVASSSPVNPVSGISTGDIKDWATIGVLLTAAISFFKGIVTRFTSKELTELQKTILSGIVCVVAAVFYSVQNGYFSDLDWRNLSSIVAAIGVVSTVTKVFYDGVTNPLLKLVSGQVPSSKLSSEILKPTSISTPTPTSTVKPKDSIEDLARDTAKNVAVATVSEVLNKELEEQFDKLFNRLDSSSSPIHHSADLGPGTVSSLTLPFDDVEVDPTAGILKDDSEVYDYERNPG